VTLNIFHLLTPGVNVPTGKLKKNFNTTNSELSKKILHSRFYKVNNIPAFMGKCKKISARMSAKVLLMNSMQVNNKTYKKYTLFASIVKHKSRQTLPNRIPKKHII